MITNYLNAELIRLNWPESFDSIIASVVVEVELTSMQIEGTVLPSLSAP